jgi:hypothetical protein
MSLRRPSTALQVIWGTLAVAALGATWSNNIMFALEDPNAGLTGFVAGGFANHAAASLTLDLAFLTAAVIVWMASESRRLKMRGLWAYVIFSFAIAISVTTPIFMLMRERKLAQGTDVIDKS